MLDDRYLLRAGSMLVVPSAAINRSKAAWGEDAEQFNPRRFVLSNEEMKERAPGFLSFGMAPHMCPGRYFATGEVIAVTALFLLRFDMRPVRGWVEPKTSKGAVGVSTGLPDESVDVILEERKAFEGMDWSFCITPGHGKRGLVIG